MHKIEPHPPTAYLSPPPLCTAPQPARTPTIYTNVTHLKISCASMLHRDVSLNSIRLSRSLCVPLDVVEATRIFSIFS